MHNLDTGSDLIDLAEDKLSPTAVIQWLLDRDFPGEFESRTPEERTQLTSLVTGATRLVSLPGVLHEVRLIRLFSLDSLDCWVDAEFWCHNWAMLLSLPNWPTYSHQLIDGAILVGQVNLQGECCVHEGIVVALHVQELLLCDATINSGAKVFSTGDCAITSSLISDGAVVVDSTVDCSHVASDSKVINSHLADTLIGRASKVLSSRLYSVYAVSAHVEITASEVSRVNAQEGANIEITSSNVQLQSSGFNASNFSGRICLNNAELEGDMHLQDMLIEASELHGSLRIYGDEWIDDRTIWIRDTNLAGNIAVCTETLKGINVTGDGLFIDGAFHPAINWTTEYPGARVSVHPVYAQVFPEFVKETKLPIAGECSNEGEDTGILTITDSPKLKRRILKESSNAIETSGSCISTSGD